MSLKSLHLSFLSVLFFFTKLYRQVIYYTKKEGRGNRGSTDCNQGW